MSAIGKPRTGTIVLIHGLWMTPRSWEQWSDRYTASGHRVLAPAWPGLEREVEELRRDPSSIAGVGLGEIANHYERTIRGLDEPPIIMGHSFGAHSSRSFWPGDSASPAWPSIQRRSGVCFRSHCPRSGRPGPCWATLPTRTRQWA